MTKHAALRWIFSRFVLNLAMYGTQTGILSNRLDHSFVGKFLGTTGAHLQVPSQEAQGLVGFVADVVNVQAEV